MDGCHPRCLCGSPRVSILCNTFQSPYYYLGQLQWFSENFWQWAYLEISDRKSSRGVGIIYVE